MHFVIFYCDTIGRSGASMSVIVTPSTVVVVVGTFVCVYATSVCTRRPALRHFGRPRVYGYADEPLGTGYQMVTKAAVIQRYRQRRVTAATRRAGRAGSD